MNIENFVEKLIKNRIIVIFMIFLVAVYGVYSYYVIPKQENPNTAVAAAVITTVYPGASPQEVEKLVTDKIEEKIKTLKNVDYFTSMSMDSASVVVIMYSLDVGIEAVEPQLRQKISDVQKELPEMCYAPEINTEVIDNNQFIISLSSGVYSEAEILDYANQIKSTIEKVDGVQTVTINGQREKQVVVEADIEQLQLYGISIETVLQVMQAQNLSIPSGSIQYETGRIAVSSPAVFESLKDIENTVVGGASDSLSFVKLKDIANVYIEDVGEAYYSQDGKNAILLTGSFQDGKNAVTIGKELRKTIDKVKSETPNEIIFHEVLYSPEDIAKSINDFIKNLIESIILIVIVVMIGIQLRNGLVISLALPLSILITFIVMNILKIEFQFISIAALIVSLGILVDNAIVISEAIQQNLNENMEKMKAITMAVKETAIPVLTSTLTTIVTFGIIYFAPGVVGKIAGTIPTVVIAALTASYIIAMFVIPVFAYLFFKPESKKRIEKRSYVKEFFDKLLDIGLKHKALTIVFSFLTLGVAAILAMQLGLRFFPFAGKPVIYINVSGETMSIDSTSKICSSIDDVLKNDELVDNFTYSVGEGLPSFFLTVPTLTASDNAAQYMLQLNADKLKEIGDVEAAARYIQGKLDAAVAGAKIEVKCLEYSMPVEAKITLSVSGDDINEVNRVANELTDMLSDIKGTDYIRNTSVVPQYQYKVKLDSDVLSAYGLLKYDVVKQINTSIMGATASTYTALGANMNIVVRGNVKSLDDIENLPIVGSAADTKILLGQVSEIELEPAVTLVNHYNGEEYVNVLSNVLPGYSAVNIENTLQEMYINDIDISNVSITSRGEISNMLSLVLSLGVSAIFAVGIIYLILLVQFKDFKKPLNILTSIPLSLIGCCFGLWVFKMDIQVMALLGLVSLFGIVVNNGILLIEVIDSEILAGKSIENACRNAVNKRFRPILLSSTTTCIGLVPLILSNDSMTSPMASVLLFGLLFSTILTMVVVPTIYALTEENKQKRQVKKGFKI